MNIQHLGRADYSPIFDNMRRFTELRTEQTADEIWVVEHHPVYTLGLAGDVSHLLNPTTIPLVKTDRGGQITYHGLGQVVLYPLLDLHRYGLKVREYVALLEDALIAVLSDFHVVGAQRKVGAPGVYVPKNGDLAKIAALGIKVRRGCTYHGLSLNVCMDLSPFQNINPCGYAGLETVDMASVGVRISVDQVQRHLVNVLISKLDAARLAMPL